MGNNSIGQAFAAYFNSLTNTFRNPLEDGEDTFENASIASSIVRLGILTVMYSLCSVLYAVIRVVKYHMDVDDGSIANIIGNFFLPYIYVVIMAGVVFGVYALVNLMFIKRAVNIRAILGFASAPAIVMTFGVVVNFLRQLLRVLAGTPGSIISNVVFGTIMAGIGVLSLLIGIVNLRKLFVDFWQLMIVILISVAALSSISYTFTYIFHLFDGSFFTIPM